MVAEFPPDDAFDSARTSILFELLDAIAPAVLAEASVPWLPNGAAKRLV